MEVRDICSCKTAFYNNDVESNPKALILLVHGIGEHAGRYRTWAERFNRAGISFRSFDLPGHGQSAGRRGVMPPLEKIYDMFDTVIEGISADIDGVPLFLYGHSLGGGLVLNYIIRRKPSVRGAIVTSPWVRLAEEPPKLKVLLASVAKKLMPGMTQPSGLNINSLSRDREVVALYKSDPLVHGMISAGLFASMTDAAAETLARASEIGCPLLLAHGRDDMITSPSGSVEVAGSAPVATLKLWDGGYHELHNDHLRDEHFDFIIEWIDTLL
ncbi:MAG: lysophospholipase [Bacteroidales bacterium]|nr:lysophospholipase [Bacteroidales bacterium]